MKLHHDASLAHLRESHGLHQSFSVWGRNATVNIVKTLASADALVINTHGNDYICWTISHIVCETGFQVYSSSQCQEKIDTKMCICFLKTVQHMQGYSKAICFTQIKGWFCQWSTPSWKRLWPRKGVLQGAYNTNHIKPSTFCWMNRIQANDIHIQT